MNKTFWVAWREFVATVTTKGFILGVLGMPVLMIAAISLVGVLMNKSAPSVTGRVAVIDPTDQVAPLLVDEFTPEAFKKRDQERAARIAKELGGKISADEATKNQIQSQIEAQANSPMNAAAMATKTTLTLERLPDNYDVQAARNEILKAEGREKDAAGENPRLALIVVQPDAVTLAPGKDKLGAYDYYVAPKLDVQVQGDIQSQVNRALVDARLTASGFDAAKIRALTERPDVSAKAVTKEGDRTTNEVAKMLIPGAFMFLLWISVFTAGQYLLTSTIEEKSSRVMEVLLSAVSPMQLLVGKIVGQMAVGLTILALYSGVGVVSLIVFAMQHLIDPWNLVYLVFFFFIAFFFIATLMASIGSAVSDVREAQSLLGPVMMVLVIPMMLWMPIMRNPNSTFATVCSFIPPINPFIMVLRLSGSEKIPTWQIPVSIAIGIVGVIVCCWAAAKIFRIGVLMYGKPPNFRTLITWVRMA